jgi:hypothetical protein
MSTLGVLQYGGALEAAPKAPVRITWKVSLMVIHHANHRAVLHGTCGDGVLLTNGPLMGPLWRASWAPSWANADEVIPHLASYP